MIRTTLIGTFLATARAYTDPGTGLFLAEGATTECASVKTAYQGGCCGDETQDIALQSSAASAVGLSESRIATILKRGYLVAAVWHGGYHCEPDAEPYASSAHKELFPDVDHNPVPTYTYVLKNRTTWAFEKVMLTATPKSVTTDANPSGFMMSKYTHENLGEWVHTKAYPSHQDSLIPAMIAKALGVGLQIVPTFITGSSGNPDWFGFSHLASQGLVDMTGNTITPKFTRNFAWGGMPLPAYTFSMDIVYVTNTHLTSCGLDASASKNDVVICLAGQDMLMAPVGTTCQEALGKACTDADVALGIDLGLSNDEWCNNDVNGAVAVAWGLYSLESGPMKVCPEKFAADYATGFELKRDLLSVVVAPDLELFQFAKGVMDFAKSAAKTGLGRANSDAGFPSDATATAIATYPGVTTPLLFHGNALLSTYGNMREAYALIGKDAEADTPGVGLYDEWYF